MLGELHLDFPRVLVGRHGIDHGIGGFLGRLCDSAAGVLGLFLGFFERLGGFLAECLVGFLFLGCSETHRRDEGEWY